MTSIIKITFPISVICYFSVLGFFLMTFNGFHIESGLFETVLFGLTIILFGIGILRIISFQKDYKVDLSFFKINFPNWLIILLILNQLILTWHYLHVLELQEGVLGIIDGKKVIHNHGSIIRELSNEEYEQNLLLVFRQSLGHFLIFLGAAVFFLFPIKIKTIANTK